MRPDEVYYNHREGKGTNLKDQKGGREMEGFKEMTFNQYREMTQNMIDALIAKGATKGEAAVMILESIGIRFDQEAKEKDSSTATND